MFEIKVRCPGLSWEETPVFLTGDECVFTYSTGQQFALATRIARCIAKTARDEVRWNWKGNSQGHYVTSWPTPAVPHCPICGYAMTTDSTYIGYRCLDRSHWQAAGLTTLPPPPEESPPRR